MSGRPLEGLYPVGDRQPERLRTPGGKRFDALTLDNLLAGQVEGGDFAVSADTLRLQSEVARAAGRDRLADNFERAAELVGVPQDVILETYELLRPGRANAKDELLVAAARLRRDFAATRIAAFIEEAAAVYERRGLFRRRY